MTKNRKGPWPKTVLMGVLLLASALSAESRSPNSPSRQWRVAGQNLDNSRSQPKEHSITAANVSGLRRNGVHDGWRCLCHSHRGW